MAEKRYLRHEVLLRKVNYICLTYGVPAITTKRFKKAIADSIVDDVVEIIRCKNCKYKDVDLNSTTSYCHMLDIYTSDDDYCSFAVKREVVIGR